MTDVTISVVSHGQMMLVGKLLNDLAMHCSQTKLELVLTLNVPEALPEWVGKLPFPVRVLRNSEAKGFGENHNQAFQFAQAPVFCVVNPDIRIAGDFFCQLIDRLQDHSVGVVAPLIVNEVNDIEDSARKFPTPLKIVCKLVGKCRGPDYALDAFLLEPDWVGGMFMAFRSEIYSRMGGFDTKFFLYYEDVDLCARIWLSGLRVVLLTSIRATHVAQRSSHRNFAYSKLHFSSMMRFFLSTVFFKALWQRARLR